MATDAPAAIPRFRGDRLFETLAFARSSGRRARRRALESMLDKFRPNHDPIWLVYPQTRHLSPKVRAFIDFLASRLR